MGWWDSVIFDSNNLRMKYNWIIMLLVVSFAGCNGVEESLGDEPHDTELSDVESLIYGKWYPKVDVGEKIDVNFYPYFYYEFYEDSTYLNEQGCYNYKEGYCIVDSNLYLFDDAYDTLVHEILTLNDSFMELFMEHGDTHRYQRENPYDY